MIRYEKLLRERDNLVLLKYQRVPPQLTATETLHLQKLEKTLDIIEAHMDDKRLKRMSKQDKERIERMEEKK